MYVVRDHIFTDTSFSEEENRAVMSSDLCCRLHYSGQSKVCTYYSFALIAYQLSLQITVIVGEQILQS